MGFRLSNLLHTQPVKKLVYAAIGVLSYPRLCWVNKFSVSGMEHLKNLPNKKVLFVSNHQTYFADVIAFLHIFCAFKWRKINKLGVPYYLLWPFTHVKFIAAEETMKSNWLSKLFALAGAINIKRTWREAGKEINRSVDVNDISNIEQALGKNWVITFPQGTTKPFAPGRKGTAHLIKECRPIVVPVVINGFWRAFNKTGLKFKKKGVIISVRIKAPLEIDYNAELDVILEDVMNAIEQSKKFMLLGKHNRGAA